MITPPSSSRAEEETSRLWATRHRIERFLRRRDFKRTKKKTLTCALVAEQSRMSPASSGSTTALDRMAEGLKKGSKGGERRTDKEDEESVATVQLTVQPSRSKQSSCFSLSAAFSLPSSSFLGQSRRRPSVLPQLYPRDGGKDKEDDESVAEVQPTVHSSLSKPSLFLRPCLFPLPLSSANQPRRLPSLLPLL
jgi:hypothetical protein